MPRFITYIPTRGTGEWRLHMTIGHLRLALRGNGYGKTPPTWWNEKQIKNNADWESSWRIYEIGQSGTWSEVDIGDVFRKELW